jgi:hypothetical protein
MFNNFDFSGSLNTLKITNKIITTTKSQGQGQVQCSTVSSATFVRRKVIVCFVDIGAL